MSVELYPVPGSESEVDELVESFLESTVSEEGLIPNKQFLILLFGEEASEAVETVTTVARDQDPTVEQALEIGKLRVEALDERRLNTFTTSLLYNMLETDPDADLQATIQSDRITDEDERKIDYYLPRVVDTVTELVETQEDAIEASLHSMFPIEVQTDRASDMNDRLEKDIVTDQTIIDYLLLASGATDATEDVRSLVKFLRENDIDDSGYISGGSDNISGYKRVFSLSYDLPTDGFRDEFRTAQQLYEEGATGELFNVLNRVDPEIDIREIYSHEAPIERLLTSQFAGNDRKIAERLLRTINGTRAIQNHREHIDSEYTETRDSLRETIEDTQKEITRLQSHNDTFTSEKIEVSSAEIDQFENVIERVDQITSQIIRYLFGVEREQRTSVFTTIETRIGQYHTQLQDRRSEIDMLINELDQLNETKDGHLNTIDRIYEEIQDTSVTIDVPPVEQVKTDLDSRWDNRLQELKSDLPVIDLDKDDDEIDATIDEWEQLINEAKQDLVSLAQPIDKLETFNQQIQQIEQKRERTRESLETVIGLMEDTA